MVVLYFILAIVGCIILWLILIGLISVVTDEDCTFSEYVKTIMEMIKEYNYKSLFKRLFS